MFTPKPCLREPRLQLLGDKLRQQSSVPSPCHRVSGILHGGPEKEERGLLRSGLGGIPEGADSYIPGTCHSGSGSRNSGYSGVLGLSANKGSLSTKKILKSSFEYH